VNDYNDRSENRHDKNKANHTSWDTGTPRAIENAPFNVVLSELVTKTSTEDGSPWLNVHAIILLVFWTLGVEKGELGVTHH
jgi:hypothetical protein